MAKWLVNLQGAGASLDAPFTIPDREISTWPIPITIRLKTTATSRSLTQNAGRLSLRAPVKALVFETVNKRDRQPFYFKPEPSREPQILRVRISERDKMNISEYPFLT